MKKPAALQRAVAYSLTQLIFLAGSAAWAAEAELPAQARLRAQVLTDPSATPTIDGRLDEAVWRQAPLHDAFYQYEPTDKLPAPTALRTTVQVLVDDQALIIGVRAFDAPDNLRGTLSRRDQVQRDQDYIGVWLDPTGHGRAAQFIKVSLAGVVSDGLYNADEDEEDLGPDFPVTTAVQRLSDGYSMEIRWPLANLRYPYQGGGAWRMMVARSVPHADGTLLVSAPLTKEALSFIAQQQEIEGMDGLLQSVRDRGFFSVRPELTARTRRLQDDDAPRRRDHDLDLGAEINWRPRADWIFNATLNPDFSQVELDVPPSSGGSRIALSLEEKRGFFLESADVLGLPLPAFYSRTIADPRWGVRATWRGAKADATAFSARDEAGGTVLRGSPYLTDTYLQTEVSQASLLRSRWHGQPFSLGVLLSERDYGEGRNNRAVGVDGQWSGDWFGDAKGQVLWNLMRSDNTAGFDGDSQPVRLPRRDGDYLSLRADYSSADWSHEFDWERIGAGFVHDNGFVAQSGVSKVDWVVTRRLGDADLKLGEQQIGLYDIEPGLRLHETRTLSDPLAGIEGGEVVERRIQPGIEFWGPRRSMLWVDLGFDWQRARPHGRLHPIRALHWGFETSPWPWLASLAGEFTWGRRLDAEADRVGRGGNALLKMQLRFPLPGGLSLESDHRWNRAWVRDPSGGPGYAEGSWRWLGVLHFTANDSLRLIAQNTVIDRKADETLELDAWSERERHRSVMYRHTWGHGRSWSAGLVHERLPGREVKELTVKFQWDTY